MYGLPFGSGEHQWVVLVRNGVAVLVPGPERGVELVGRPERRPREGLAEDRLGGWVEVEEVTFGIDQEDRCGQGAGDSTGEDGLDGLLVRPRRRLRFGAAAVRAALPEDAHYT